MVLDSKLVLILVEVCLLLTKVVNIELQLNQLVLLLFDCFFCLLQLLLGLQQTCLVFHERAVIVLDFLQLLSHFELLFLGCLEIQGKVAMVPIQLLGPLLGLVQSLAQICQILLLRPQL